MANLFTEQLEERERIDASMKQMADRLIEESVSTNLSDDLFDGVRSNDTALNRILSQCGMRREQLERIEKEDLLFTSVEEDTDWFRWLSGYLVGVDREGNYVGLVPGLLFGHYFYYDRRGRKQPVNKKTAGNFTRVYCLCRLLPEKKLSIRELLEYLLSFMRHRAFLSYIGLSLLGGVLGLVFPMMINRLMSYIQEGAGGDSSVIAWIACGGLAVESLRLLSNIALNVFEADFTNMVTYNVKNAVLYRYLQSGDSSAGEKDASEIWNALDTQIPGFLSDVLSSGLRGIPCLTFTTSYCAAAILCLGGSSIWLFLLLAVMTVLLWSIYGSFDRWYARALNNRILGDHFLFNMFKGIEKIRSRNAQRRIYLGWSGIFAEEAAADKKRKGYTAMQTALQDFLMPLLTVFLILTVWFTAIPYSSFLTAMLLAGLLVPQISDLAVYAEKLFNSRSQWENISYLFDGTPGKEKKTVCTDFTGELTVRNVSFAYPGMERLLDNVSFHVNRGEYIGIVGMSGCGKSTLLKLLLGILTPDRGEISYGNYPVSGTDQRSILRNMGIVLQNETLIPGTIRQNMMMQPRPVTEEQIWKTLETVGIADLVRSFPYGLDTALGMSGAEMSGGQMQKLLIARAIISGPKMIVFDEATSALDNVSQKEIKDALDSMDCTRIVVAHRLSTVRDCDRIILLENGKITQQGTYEELVEVRGLFRDLVLCQGAELIPEG
ncbi:MAG: ATP-binding cassette domain-containing protein [Eubacteriales bacterium]|nr:ATP-binding cassette domain-containing protein [Eubacteriales bacterium]